MKKAKNSLNFRKTVKRRCEMIEAFRKVQEYCKKQANCDHCEISEEIGARCFFLKPKDWNLPDPTLKKVKDHIMSRFMRKE